MKSTLIVISSSIVFLLGFMHLVYTYWGTKLYPRNKEIVDLMKQSTLRITSETTMWKAWIGFNSTHSMAALFFGLVYGYMGVSLENVLFASSYLIMIGFLMLSGFLLLSWKYFFRIPLIGISISLICYLVAVILQVYK